MRACDAMIVASVRPTMIEEQPVGPAAGLFQDQTGRTGAPFFSAQKWISSGGPEKDRPETQDQAADWFLG